MSTCSLFSILLITVSLPVTRCLSDRQYVQNCWGWYCVSSILFVRHDHRRWEPLGSKKLSNVRKSIVGGGVDPFWAELYTWGEGKSINHSHHSLRGTKQSVLQGHCIILQWGWDGGVVVDSPCKFMTVSCLAMYTKSMFACTLNVQTRTREKRCAGENLAGRHAGQNDWSGGGYDGSAIWAVRGTRKIDSCYEQAPFRMAVQKQMTPGKGCRTVRCCWPSK